MAGKPSWTRASGASLSRRIPAAAALGAAVLIAFAAPVQGQTYVLQGGTVHDMTGGAPFVGTVVIRDGRILAVGEDIQAPAGSEVIDVSGRHVYPGLFDAISQLGLTEIGAVDVTNDYQEQGGFNPHLQAAVAIHPATEHIPVARANGIAITMTAPRGGSGAIAGQASLVGLDGWTIEEMRINPGAAMVINYPSLEGRRFRGAVQTGWRERERRYEEAVDRLDEWLEAGRVYDDAINGGVDLPRDLKNEAMAKVTNREMPVLLAADGERDIRNAVEWAQRQDLRFVITGGRGAWKIADWLAERGVGIILSPTQSMPTGPDESYDEAYANPGKLHAAGVKIAFATFGSSNSRTLPYEAAQAVPYGLPREAALEAITRNAASMLGFEGIGTIEEGSLANVMITDGDPLEIQTQVTDLFILGRGVSLDNRHQALYEKYRARPRPRTVS